MNSACSQLSVFYIIDFKKFASGCVQTPAAETPEKLAFTLLEKT